MPETEAFTDEAFTDEAFTDEAFTDEAFTSETLTDKAPTDEPLTNSEPWEYWLHIPHDPRAVTVSRRTLRLILTLHGLAHFADTAELLATELVANAVCHTKGPAALRVRWSAGVLRIGAWDASLEPPAPPAPLDRFADVDDAEEGRGLALVKACAAEWGWQPLGRNGHRGKYVWCDLVAA